MRRIAAEAAKQPRLGARASRKSSAASSATTSYGSFYRQFALTIAFSTILSMVNSLTLSPAMCALFLQSPKERKDLLGRALDGVLGWFFRLFNRTFEGFKAIYIHILRKLIRWSLLVLVVYVGLLVLTGYMSKNSHRLYS